MATMKNYNYWEVDWPKICFQTFGHGGRMFESIETRDAGGLVRYEVGQEFDLETALLNARPDRRVMTICVFEGNGKKAE